MHENYSQPDLLPDRCALNGDHRVSIIIPVFNQASYTRTCLERLLQNTALELCQIIVVDNHSTDGTPELLKSFDTALQVITNEKNLGFARACNQGARAATGRYLLFLNNDTEVQPGWLEPLIETIESDPDIAAAGGQLRYPDGTVQHAGVIMITQKDKCSLLPRHVFSGEDPDRVPVHQPMFLQAVTAACMLVDKAMFDAVGGFDEAYWNGSEDADFCFKLQQAGKKIAYEPRSVVIHHESKSGEERQSARDSNNARLRARWERIIQPDVIQEDLIARRDPGSPIEACGKTDLDPVVYLEIAAAWWTGRKVEEALARNEQQLEEWLVQVLNDTDAIFSSRRWKIGHGLVRLTELALLKPRPGLAFDHIFEIKKAFQSRHDSKSKTS